MQAAVTPNQDSSVLEHARALHRTQRALDNKVTRRGAKRRKRTVHRSQILSNAQLTTLSVIRETGELTLKALADGSGVSAPSASAMVDKLVELGLAERRASAQDRREVRISLTPAGDKAAREWEGEALTAIADLLDRVGPETAKLWREVYARIQDCLDREQQSELIVK